ncbi:hypothetical protein IHV25_04875 [Phaeovibrio sulfidiphilus]|uniref:Uncharacterized protein n=1 Tax=Phaeovibrio sulfidiphilus TaxID=1220600 RepID=A0A8J7CDF6_9PROT|nr:hypothetical protein [Phaeovibrio sulfidiphilus]MBE1236979.1 hypothetical protein [Phaeovibrio sulfidiphilus]
MHGKSAGVPQHEDRRIREARQRVRDMQNARTEIDRGLHVLSVTCDALDEARGCVARAGDVALGVADEARAPTREPLGSEIAAALAAAIETIRGAVVDGLNLLHGDEDDGAPAGMEIAVADAPATVIGRTPVLAFFEGLLEGDAVCLPESFGASGPPSDEERQELASRLALVSMRLHQEGLRYRQHLESLVQRADFVRTMIETVSSTLLPHSGQPLSDADALRMASSVGTSLRAARDLPALAPRSASSILDLF